MNRITIFNASIIREAEFNPQLRFGAGIGLTRLARAMELLQKQTDKEALELLQDVE